MFWGGLIRPLPCPRHPASLPQGNEPGHHLRHHHRPHPPRHNRPHQRQRTSHPHYPQFRLPTCPYGACCRTFAVAEPVSGRAGCWPWVSGLWWRHGRPVPGVLRGAEPGRRRERPVPGIPDRPVIRGAADNGGRPSGQGRPGSLRWSSIRLLTVAARVSSAWARGRPRMENRRSPILSLRKLNPPSDSGARRR